MLLFLDWTPLVENDILTRPVCQNQMKPWSQSPLCHYRLLIMDTLLTLLQYNKVKSLNTFWANILNLYSESIL